MLVLQHDPLLVDILQVVAQAPQEMRDPWLALNDGPFVPDQVAASFYLAPGPKWVILDGETAISVGGFIPIRKGVYREWLANTPASFTTHWRGVTKLARRATSYMIGQPDIHRLECVTVATQTRHVDWYRFLGYSFEGISRAAGVNGEDLATFACVREP